MSGRDFYEPERVTTRGSDAGGSFGEFGSIGNPAPTAEQMPAIIPMGGTTGSVDRAYADIVTAQRVAIKRDLPRIVREIEEAADMAGPKFYYQWPTKNRDGTQGVVEGPSIKCAMALCTIWGNCRIEAMPVQETNTHWVFLARFTDFEKGVTVVRSFQQRRNQRAGGKMDADRMEDIAFQIGQSKAVRNTVIAALGIYVDRAVGVAKSSAYKWVEKNLSKARDIVLEQAATLRVPVDRMERLAGRKVDSWLVPDVIQLRSKLQSIEDGFDDLDTAFPKAEEEPEQTTKQSGAGETGPVVQKQPVQDKPAETQADPKPPRRTQSKTAQDKPAETKPPAADEKPVEQEQEQPKPQTTTQTEADPPTIDGKADEVRQDDPPATGTDDPGFSGELEFT